MGVKIAVFLCSKIFFAGLLLLFLFILDSIFTDFGIRRGHITEANPLTPFSILK
ncbi:DUF5658 family protein [Viridibacillus sp. NPDC093762]|uniref:DUF5658 family protein n=1 Tax=Viridibacillus sp. NPDC093762 TaxID=3390720 RepID=UPI003D02F756